MILDESFLETANYISYDELLSGMIGNMSEEQLDQEIKLLNRFARVLKVKPKDMVIVATDDDQYFPDWYAKRAYKVAKDIMAYEVADMTVIPEKRNGVVFLYFPDITSSEYYFDYVDDLNS